MKTLGILMGQITAIDNGIKTIADAEKNIKTGTDNENESN